MRVRKGPDERYCTSEVFPRGSELNLGQPGTTMSHGPTCPRRHEVTRQNEMILGKLWSDENQGEGDG